MAESPGQLDAVTRKVMLAVDLLAQPDCLAEQRFGLGQLAKTAQRISQVAQAPGNIAACLPVTGVGFQSGTAETQGTAAEPFTFRVTILLGVKTGEAIPCVGQGSTVGVVAGEFSGECLDQRQGVAIGRIGLVEAMGLKTPAPGRAR